MTTAAEFWAYVQPSGLTAEAELVLLWETLRDCDCRRGLGKPKSRRHDDDGEDAEFSRLYAEDESLLLALAGLVASGRLH